MNTRSSADTTTTSAKFDNFIAQFHQIPRPVIAIILESPAWFDETQKAAFERIVEMCPEISGLVSGYVGTTAPGDVLINGTRDVEFRRVRESFGYGLLTAVESVLLNPRCTDKSRIGPFTIIFIEPDASYTVAVDAWVLKGYFRPSFARREAIRDVANFVSAPVTYDFTFQAEDDSKYGPLTREQGTAVLRTLFGNDASEMAAAIRFKYRSPLLGLLDVQQVFGDDPSVGPSEICRATIRVLGREGTLSIQKADSDVQTAVNPQNRRVHEDILAGLTDGLSKFPNLPEIIEIAFPVGQSYMFGPEE